jgi:hypothetical protein
MTRKLINPKYHHLIFIKMRRNAVGAPARVVIHEYARHF